MIDPKALAFDVDGVFADTMTLFLDIAREEYDIRGIAYEDITCYSLEECVDIDTTVVEAILTRIVDGSYSDVLKPFQGAPEVITRMGGIHNPILFVTARPYQGPISDWIRNVLPLDSSSIEVVATGSFEGKADVLLNKNISYFVEDRLETCFSLESAGITPVVFKQPWNRKRHPFMEVGTWDELEALIKF
ncbi:haloacid dehalogenase [Desulfobacteraceae bacterium SEEP-SAG9]|nr:haloacid dehalogenase [Desulfobacteraceae bacterium SEEP-SAG9]